jgi:hypothetical protein
MGEEERDRGRATGSTKRDRELDADEGESGREESALGIRVRFLRPATAVEKTK